MRPEYDALKDVVLLGGGGHAKVVLEAILKYHGEYRVIGITDSDAGKHNQRLMNVPFIGDDGILEELYARGLRKAFISLGTVDNPLPRLYLYKRLKETGFSCINVFHGRSIVSEYVSLGEGNAILAGAVVNAGAAIGNNCILNTGSIVEHDCVIGDNVHVAPGSVISGAVRISGNSFIGAGAVVMQGVSIGEGCTIGAGAVVIRDLPPGSRVAGVPAREIGTRR